MSAYEIVSSLLLLATLLVLVVYTFKTATIARASNEQSEALQKPCIVVVAPYMGREADERPGDDRRFTTALSWEKLGPSLHVINIGNGPALKVDFEFVDAPLEANASRKLPFPYLLKAETMAEREVRPTGCRPPAEGGARFRITYESMSGAKYETLTEIIDGEYLVGFKFGRHPLRG